VVKTMSTRYEQTEDAIRTRLLDDVDDQHPSPFKAPAVVTYGSQMTDAEILTEIENLRKAAPAALVLWAGSDFTGTGVLDEQAEFHVVVVANTTSKTAALRGDTGVYSLVDWARERLHNWRDDAGGAQNPLNLVRVQRLGEPGRPPTAAAMALVFRTQIDRSW
jgi:hypothetical protein